MFLISQTRKTAAVLCLLLFGGIQRVKTRPSAVLSVSGFLFATNTLRDTGVEVSSLGRADRRLISGMSARQLTKFIRGVMAKLSPDTFEEFFNISRQTLLGYLVVQTQRTA